MTHTLLRSLALRARPLGGAGTGVAVDAVGAGASVLAGIARALVHVLITVLPCPARVTATDVASCCILWREKKKGKKKNTLTAMVSWKQNREGKL